MTEYKYKVFVFEKMSLPITIQIVNTTFSEKLIKLLDDTIKEVEKYITKQEEKFSPFLENSYINKAPKLLGSPIDKMFFDEDYQNIYVEAQIFAKKTKDIFNPFFSGKYNPTGLTKGFILEKVFNNYLEPLLATDLVEAVAINGGGDIQCGVSGTSDYVWYVGVENPFNITDMVASYALTNGAIATSANTKRGNHIKSFEKTEQLQVTVVADDIVTADVFATVGMATNRKKWEQLIKEHKLSGITIYKNKEIQFYNKGDLDVKKS